MYNILSLGLGILAWILGGSAALRGKFGGLSFGSLGCCTVSLMVQFFELDRRAELGDFAAIDDTIGALTFVAAVLVGVTLVVNGVALLSQIKDNRE